MLFLVSRQLEAHNGGRGLLGKQRCSFSRARDTSSGEAMKQVQRFSLPRRVVVGPGCDVDRSRMDLIS